MNIGKAGGADVTCIWEHMRLCKANIWKGVKKDKLQKILAELTKNIEIVSSFKNLKKVRGDK